MLAPNQRRVVAEHLIEHLAGLDVHGQPNGAAEAGCY